MKVFIRHYVFRSCWIVLVIAALHTTADCSHAQHEIFDASVIQKWKDYEAFSHTLQGTVRSQVIRNGKPQELIKRFKPNRECALVIVPNNRDPLLLFCTLANPHYTAAINLRKSDLGNAVLQRYNPLPGGTVGVSSFDLAFYEISRHFAYGPSAQLRQVVSDPSFKVTEVAREIQNGQELIRVDHIYNFGKGTANDGFRTRVQGSLWLDASRCWCIRRFKASHEVSFRGERSSDMEEEVVCETINHPSGFPILKSRNQHVKIFHYKNNQKIEGTQNIDYELEVNESVPNNEFTLAAFGLPEPGERTHPAKRHRWLLASAGVCVLLAIVFRYLARRARSKPAT